MSSAGLPCGLHEGRLEQPGHQVLGAAVVPAYPLSVARVIGTLLDRAVQRRISRDAELEGIDLVEHAESAYELDGVAGTGMGHSGGALGGSSGWLHTKRDDRRNDGGDA